MSDPFTLLPGPVVTVLGNDAAEAAVGDDELLGLYRHMAVARGVNDLAITLQRQGQLGLHLSLRGQEAAQVGSASALQPQDWVFPQGRDLAAAITRGLDPADLLHVWRGTWLCHHDPVATRFAPYVMPIATQLLHATGLAMAARIAGDPVVVLAYCGDGGTSEGDAHEAMNVAAVFDAPVVFFVQNNGWSISVPLARQTRAPTLAHRGVGYGMPGVVVDGNDVLACLDGHAGRGGARPDRRRPDADRGADLPRGRPQHVRRPHPLPARRTRSRGGSSATPWSEPRALLAARGRWRRAGRGRGR